MHFLYLSYALPFLANCVKRNLYLQFTHPSNALEVEFHFLMFRLTVLLFFRIISSHLPCESSGLAFCLEAPFLKLLPFCNIPVVAAKNDVIAPIKVITIKAMGDVLEKFRPK